MIGVKQQLEVEQAKLAELRSQIQERENLVNAMRAQVEVEEENKSAHHGESRNGADTLSNMAAMAAQASGTDAPVDSMTKSFQRLQSGNNLALNNAGQHNQPLVSTLLRKASTLTRQGGKVR